jgi:hypothetical protein
MTPAAEKLREAIRDLIDNARGNLYKNSGRKSLHLLRPPNLKHDITMTEAETYIPKKGGARKRNFTPEEIEERRLKKNARCRAWREKYPDRQKKAKDNWNQRNKDRIAESDRRRAKENPEKRRKLWADWYARNRVALLARQKEERAKNPAAAREKKKRHYDKRRNSPKFRLVNSLRSRLVTAMRRIQSKKNFSTQDDFGCSSEFLALWIERKFKRGMTWENYGSVWHIDHVIPLSAFDIADERQRKMACHYTNLQPMRAFENMSKKDKITQPQMSLLFPAA